MTFIHAAQKVSDNDFKGEGGFNNLSGGTATLEHIVASSYEAGISSEIPAFFKYLYARAEDRGLAEYSQAALIEVLRNPAN